MSTTAGTSLFCLHPQKGFTICSLLTLLPQQGVKCNNNRPVSQSTKLFVVYFFKPKYLDLLSLSKIFFEKKNIFRLFKAW